MDSHQKQRTAGLQPNVRSACEPCHERKVRCISTFSGGPCDNCQSRRLDCFYLPRFKSGRRPIGNTSLHDETNNAPFVRAGSDESQPRRVRRKPSDVPSLEDQNDHFDWSGTSTSRHQTPKATLPDLDLIVSDFRGNNDFIPQDSATTVVFPQSDNHRHSDSALDGLGPLLTFDTPNSTASLNIQQDAAIAKDMKIGQKDFAALLDCCRKLQSHISRAVDTSPASATGELSATTTPASTISSTQVREMLDDVDSSCRTTFAIFGTFSRPAPQPGWELDFASASLTNALILKVFEVCDHIFSYNILNNHGLDDILLHKRLDFNLTQARVVFSKIYELTQGGALLSKDIAKNASNIEKRFKLAG